jgi:hypothetical protein
MKSRRAVLIDLVIFPSLILSGCAGGSNLGPDTTAFVNGVIAGVEAGCKVEPLIADVAALFPVFGGSVVAAVNAICAAVTKVTPTTAAPLVAAPSGSGKLVRLGFPPVVVHGHVVHFQ